jgi:hypothetical protein
VRRSALAVGLALGATACDGAAPAPLPVAGTWGLAQTAQGPSARCGEGGQVTLAQDGPRLAGSFSSRGGCDTDQVAVDFLRTGAVTEASLAGDALAFTLEGCRYRGRLTGTPPARAAGAVRCEGPPFPQAVAGDWELRR